MDKLFEILTHMAPEEALADKLGLPRRGAKFLLSKLEREAFNSAKNEEI